MGCRAILLGLFVCAFAITRSEGGGAQPFAAKASLVRYWRRTLPKAGPPPFLLEKASPLNATSVALFSGYITNHTLSDHIAFFCRAADLLCTWRTTVPNSEQKQDFGRSTFESYRDNKDFKKYKINDSTFKNYSDNANVVKDAFRDYGPKPSGLQNFQNYAPGSNVVDEGFANYGVGAGGSNEFTLYSFQTNVPRDHFSNYATDSTGTIQQFTSYADNSNVIKNDFEAYGKDGTVIISQFTSYANNSNLIANDFKAYDHNGTDPLDQFTSYAENGNALRNDFQNYATGANEPRQRFTSYAAGGNSPHNVFKTYGKDGSSLGITFSYGEDVNLGPKFTNYGKNTSASNDFSAYGQSSNASFADFSSYAKNTTFKTYANTSLTFSDYTNTTGKTSNGVEAGKFFRESILVQGKTLPMPDIKDYMPKRSFLPASLASKIPFSTQTLPELMNTFHIPVNSTMSAIMARTLGDCERTAVKDEIKKCVRSVEGMAEFAVSVLGSKVEILTTQSTAGSRGQVYVGAVTGKDGGNITRSVSCHQSLFPFLVYYCHAVPKVKVYQAELLSMEAEKKKINEGVAICHLDTTQWSAGHAAFRALGHEPGKIEVCHWIFENDLIWVPLSA